MKKAAFLPKLSSSLDLGLGLLVDVDGDGGGLGARVVVLPLFHDGDGGHVGGVGAGSAVAWGRWAEREGGGCEYRQR